MNRRADYRTFSWLNDLNKRGQLDLDPSYQRRSVWSDQYKLEFVTTVVLGYPCPPIFLYEEIRPDGSFIYRVVDGKQRLTSLFEFVDDKFPVDEKCPIVELAGKTFSQFNDDQKLLVWRYLFSVEFIEQENEQIISDIFNRINKNVARLSRQELRHARFAGRFTNATETLAEYMVERLPHAFPQITGQTRRQMRDVEYVANLLLFCEQGERSVSQDDLDVAYSKREDEWEKEADSTGQFRAAIDYLRNVTAAPQGPDIVKSRLKNQADFYSLFAAVVELDREHALPPAAQAAANLQEWIAGLAVEEEQLNDGDAAYLKAARSASNDPTPRRTRIDRVKVVLG